MADGFRGRARAWWRRQPGIAKDLVITAVLVGVLVGLPLAYTDNVPPFYVVASGSMQHGVADHLGLLDVGTVVLVQKGATIHTYEQHTVETYGESGNVILYHPYGSTTLTPIIHRAILYLEFLGGFYSAPTLLGKSCGYDNATSVYSDSGEPYGCGAAFLPLNSTLTLYNLGWRHSEAVIDLNPETLGTSSGYITGGDNNTLQSGRTYYEEVDQMLGYSTLVKPSWVIGVAEGEVPYLGSLVLLLDDHGLHVSTFTWEMTGLLMTMLVLGVAMFEFWQARRLKPSAVVSSRRGRPRSDRSARESPTPRRIGRTPRASYTPTGGTPKRSSAGRRKT